MSWINKIKKAWAETSTSPKTVREFGFILAGFLVLFPLLGALLGMLLKGKPFHYWLGWPVLGVFALVVNLFLFPVISLIYRVAMLIAHGISWVMMRIILTILFYFVLSPISIVMRLTGKDLLDQKIDKSAQTYWQKRPAAPPREQYERLF